MNVLLLDNYDSFTWNVADLISCAGASVEVVRNDATTIEAVLDSGYDAIVISPGPGHPEAAGISVELILAAAAESIPLLGICLGMQCIGEAHGARIRTLGRVVHGASSSIEHDGAGIYTELPTQFAAARYHSLVVDEQTLPPALVATAHAADDGVLMGIRDTNQPIEGVQYHPESILTEHGAHLMHNFLTRAATHNQTRSIEVA